MSKAFGGARFCWMNGSLLETDKAMVSAMEPIYLGIFEGIKAYVVGDVRGEGELNIFAWEQHMDRLWRSAAINGLKMPFSRDELLEGVKAAIHANEFKCNVYIQPRIWPRAGEPEDVHVVVPTWKFDTLLGKDNPAFSKPRRFMVSSWRRISSDSLPPQAKSWANYANSQLAIREAKRCGYDNAIFLDSRGFVSEGTLACLMTIRNGRLITPPVTASILESVTRNCFLEFIPKDLGMPVEVRDITRAELYAADEVFLCGTGGEVTPITSIDDIKLGDKYPGLHTIRIAEYYADIVSEKLPQYRRWLTPIE